MTQIPQISRLVLAFAAAVVVALILPERVHAQLTYQEGQNVSPAYEGWLENDDGSFSLVFGYMNRNWQEELNVPVGPDNSISPGTADQGQPTRFLPRRNRFVFKVRVPADFGDQEMVWTLTTRGKTEHAYGSLRMDYKLDNMVIASETGALGIGVSDSASRANTPPTVTLEGDEVRRAKVGEPVTLVAYVVDDNLPRRRRRRPPEDPTKLTEGQLRPPMRITVDKVVGLNLAWFVLRGEGAVTFDPLQVKVWEDTRTGANSPWAPLWVAPDVPEGGRYEIRVTFDRPGTYVLRGRADDGGLYDDVDVTIVVGPVT
jgi:hypothetical protein